MGMAIEMNVQFRRVFQLLGMTGILFLTACGGTRVPPPAPSGSALIQSFKTQLNAVAETGEGGSGLDGLRNDFELIEKESPQEASGIKEDLQNLLRASTPEKRKELAAVILKKM